MQRTACTATNASLKGASDTTCTNSGQEWREALGTKWRSVGAVMMMIWGTFLPNHGWKESDKWVWSAGATDWCFGQPRALGTDVNEGTNESRDVANIEQKYSEVCRRFLQ